MTHTDNDQPSVRQLLMFWFFPDTKEEDLDDLDKYKLEQAEAKLLALLMAARPPMDEYYGFSSDAEGYNRALDEYTEAIKALFKKGQ